MDPSYWQEKWDSNDIGFHQAAYNAQMVAHFSTLGLAPGAHVFVPLCGKTRDIAWLLAQGFTVSGAELSEAAVQQLFAALELTPAVSTRGPTRLYQADRLTLWAGDIFALTAQDLGQVDGIYDRAALVALPEDLRARYVAHLMDITHTARQFVLTFDYDQSQMNGPPFSIPAKTVSAYYAAHYDITQVGAVTVPSPGLKGRVAATERAFVLL